MNTKKIISTLIDNRISKTKDRKTVDLTDEQGKKTDRRPRMCRLWDINTLRTITGIDTRRKGVQK
jgi:hypothetical protein